jgi:glycosyltransferase involved in cell wall biosynthesis
MTQPPLKLVYVTPAIYSAGGVERVVTMKASYFAEKYGYDVTIIVTEGNGCDSFFPLSGKVKVVNLEINFEELWTCSFIKKVIVYLKKQRRYKKLLTQELMRICPKITISTLRREINFLNDIRDGSRKIGELHVNRINYRNFKTEKNNIIKNLFANYWSHNLVKHLKRLDCFVVLTEKDRESWKELSHVDVIPDPLPFVPVSVSPMTEKRIISVTRYSHEKGVDLLLKAWAKVEKINQDWRLDIYGNGDNASYEALIDELKIERNRCRLNGRIEDVEREYVRSSLYVLSSRFEGFGMVIVEAMACGLPVVAFDCPWGPRSIIRDGEDGLIVENGNPSALAKGLLRLMNDDIKRKEMAVAAHQNVQRFSIDKIAQQWKRLFDIIVTNTSI